MTRRSILTLALLWAAPLALAAHEGHNHKLMGVVATIHESHLEVKDPKGNARSFTLDAKTKVRRGTTILKAADIKGGERVVVVYRETKDKATGKVTTAVVEVQLGTAVTTRSSQ